MNPHWGAPPPTGTNRPLESKGAFSSFPVATAHAHRWNASRYPIGLNFPEGVPCLAFYGYLNPNPALGKTLTNRSYLRRRVSCPGGGCQAPIPPICLGDSKTTARSDGFFLDPKRFNPFFPYSVGAPQGACIPGGGGRIRQGRGGGFRTAFLG